MDYYAAEHLTRQRHDQFVREASGGQLMAKAHDLASSGQARGARTRTIHLGAVLHWSANALKARISWLISRLPDLKDPAFDHPGIGPRHT